MEAFAKTAQALEKTTDGKFWKVAGDPSGNFVHPFLLWIRQEYVSLTQVIFDALVRQGYTKFIVLGTAGCGNSMFALQFALQAAHQKRILFMKERVIHIIDGVQGVSQGPYALGSAEIKGILNDRTSWLVIDGKQEEQLKCRCRVLVACSTRPTNFEEFGKLQGSLKLYLSTWSQEEVKQFIADFEPYRFEYNRPEEDHQVQVLVQPFASESSEEMSVPGLNEALAAFKCLGGAVRYVLQAVKTADGLARWRSAIDTLGNDVDAAATVLGGSFLDNVSDRIVHIWATENHRSFKKDFCSEETINELTVAYFRRGLLHTATFLQRTVATSLVGPLWGRLYEAVVVSRLTTNKSCQWKAPTGTRSWVTGSFTPGERTVKLLSTLDELKELLDTDFLEELYCQPSNECLESVDGAMIFDDKVVLLQIFKRKDGRHGLKVDGLEKIDRVLQRNSYEVWSCVPVEHYDKTGVQAYKSVGRSTVVPKISQRVVQVDYRC